MSIVTKKLFRVLGPLALTAAATLASCTAPVETGTPAELITRGWQKFRLDEQKKADACFTAALAQLAEARAKGPETVEDKRLRIQATYGLGMVWSMGRHGENPDKARALFGEVIALDGPKGEMSPWAALAIVRDKHLPVNSTDVIDRPALRAEYAKVLDAYPQTPASEEAFLYRQSLFIQTLAPEDATASLAEIAAYLKEHPTSRFQSILYGLVSQANNTLKDYPAALAASIKSLETKEIDPTNPNMNNIGDYYRIALAAEYDVGDFATARTYLGKLIAEYPTDQRVFNAKLELRRMDQIDAADGDTSVVGELGMNPPGGPGGLPEGSRPAPGARSAATEGPHVAP